MMEASFDPLRCYERTTGDRTEASGSWKKRSGTRGLGERGVQRAVLVKEEEDARRMLLW